MKKIYFANIWTELVSVQFLELLETRGYFASGNWFAGKYHSPLISSETDLVVYAPSDPSGSLVLTPKNLVEIPTIFWAMFPDYLAGWNFEKNTYGCTPQKEVAVLLPYFKGLYGASKYVTGLMEKTYGKKFENLYPGLPFSELSLLKKTKYSDNPSVLWNHMWRLDKGFSLILDAFDILARRFPKNKFIIARKNRWGDLNYSPQRLKRKFSKFLINIPPNIKFEENYNPGADKDIQKSYWGFLAKADIGVSCSYHEGFGISMLEQAAVGLACVVPNHEVYPEIFPKECLYELSVQNLVDKISGLIKNKALLCECSELSYKSAQIFSLSEACNSFTNLFKQFI